MTKKNDFIYSTESEPHHARAKKIITQFPSVRQLIGKNPYSFVIILALVTFMIVSAWLVRDQPWWVVFVTAYIFGTYADHGLYVMIHEAGHQLIFKNKAANRWAGLIANLPQIFPASVSFERYHAKHHTYLGVHELDADLPNRWEAKLVNNYVFGKALWLFFFPLFQIFRLSRLKEIKPFDKWMAGNYAIQIVFIVAVCYFMGFHAFAYLFISFYFSIGLHPLGARWIQEHYLTESKESTEYETHSYYGAFNKVGFNIGYHNEHHDFPSIPWNKLPEIKKYAPEYYENLRYHKSLTKLFFQFIFDKEISLFDRIIRKRRGSPKLSH